MFSAIRSLLAVSLALVFLALASAARAGEGDAQRAQKTLSPYFVLENADPKLDQLPLEGTHVVLSVAGSIADVTVKQTYKNTGRRPINAKYVFPASTRAAVHGMRMKIREQVIEAVIQERAQASRTFEQAKSAGKSATLLEQERPNVFTMSVANVMPGDRVEVTLRYTELVVPTEGVYEVVYPTVVGPRYSNQPAASAPATDRWVQSPYTPQGKLPASTFTLEGSLSTGFATQAIESPSHPLKPSWDNPKLVRFTLDAAEKFGGNRDFVLRYRLAGDKIESGLSLYEANGEKFFLLQVEPPKRVTIEQIPPREYVFVVDVSGSMGGFPLETAKTLLRDLVGRLRPSDKFNVLLFEGDSQLLAPRSLATSPVNIRRAVEFMDSQSGGGGTEMLRALQRALTLSPEPGLSRSFVVLTDGYISADKQAMDYVRANLGRANVFAFGIGSSVNHYLIEGLAKAGQGEPFVVLDADSAPAVAERFRKYVVAPVLTNVRVSYTGFDAFDVEPPAVPDVLAERPVIVYGKWRGTRAGKITVSGVGGQGRYTQTFDVSATPSRQENVALRYLWARNRIATLADFGFQEIDEAAKKEVTALGLRYNLLTQFTSFVAVAKTVRNTGAPATDVKQPLPLPQGVSNSAVGGGVQSASEPELFVLLFALALAGLWMFYRQPRRAFG
ncbi:MAG TPA: VIT domain-containing protein [Polyangiaceae bacterium]|nr:VIT domain-containing protein [Polyangiaceae bacterium]